jgi:hypothetical protein
LRSARWRQRRTPRSGQRRPDQVESGHSDEIAKTLAAVADDYPSTDVSDHGNAEERTSSFNTGVAGGVPACT